MEVTTRCSGSCVYCPRTVYRDNWLNHHMSLSTFKNILAGAGKTKLLFLQGWGEPFLHPDFMSFVTLAKEAGYRVGTTTNGMHLTEREAIRVVHSEIDILAFSLAGTTARNDKIRRGTELSQVLQAIRYVDCAKREVGFSRPAIHVAYLFLPSMIEDLEGLPETLCGLGVSQVVISGLDFVPTPSLEKEALGYVDQETRENARRCLTKTVERGAEHGVEIHVQIPSLPIFSEDTPPDAPEQRPSSANAFSLPDSRCYACAENVEQALVVSAVGSVSPCVFTNLPVTQAEYVEQGTRREYERLTFGNVDRESLPAIWKSRAYSDFRSGFANGTPYERCRGCPKLYEM